MVSDVTNVADAANGQDNQNLQPTTNLRSNREYKSTIFTSYFGIPEHAAQLYEGLTRKYDLEKAQKEKKGGVQDLWNYSRKKFPSAGGQNTGVVSPKDIAFKTLEGVLYMARKNDMAFTVKDKILVIGEHQSTINRNMPLRSAIYYGRTMEQMVPAKAIYKSQKLAIPTPEFFVFYNGKEPQPLEQVLSEFWVLYEKADTRLSAFSLYFLFSFLGICGRIKIRKDERR